MIPNSKYYGTPEEWKTSIYSIDSVQNPHKVGFYAGYSDWIRDLISSGLIQPGEPIDKSVSYCGLGIESPLSTIRYYEFDSVNGEAVLLSQEQREVTNFAFFENHYPDMFVSFSGFSDVYINNPPYTRYFWSPNELTKEQVAAGQWGDHGKYSVFTAINLRRFVLLIHVVVTSSNTDVNAPTDIAILKDYIDNKNDIRTRYPYIIGAYAIPYSSFDEQLYNRSSFYERVQNLYNYPNFFTGILDEMNIPNELNLGSLYCYTNWVDTNKQPLIPLWGTVYRTAVFMSRDYGDNRIAMILGDGDIIIGGRERDTVAIRAVSLANDETYEKIRRACACYGLIFCEDEAIARNGSFDDENMYMGVLEDGIGHGKYTRGKNNQSNSQWFWGDTSESDYDPSKPPSPQYQDSTDLASLPSMLYPNHVYIDTDALTSLYVLIQEVGTIDPKKIDESLLFYGQEPLACIIGARRIYLKPPEKSSGIHNIMLGMYESNVKSTLLLNEWYRYELSAKPIERTFGNFLDFEPYTTLSLYIPYCGSINLPTNIFMGHTCKITINANVRMGIIEALVFVDNILFTSVIGNCFSDLTVTGFASATYNATLKDLSVQRGLNALDTVNAIAGHATGATISGKLKNKPGVVGHGMMGITSLAKGTATDYYLRFQKDHTAPQVMQIQKGISEISAISSLTPFISITSPLYDENYNAELYGKTTGFKCYEMGNLHDFHGYTECDDAILDNISCTVTEKNMILEALRSGVILD